MLLLMDKIKNNFETLGFGQRYFEVIADRVDFIKSFPDLEDRVLGANEKTFADEIRDAFNDCKN